VQQRPLGSVARDAVGKNSFVMTIAGVKADGPVIPGEGPVFQIAGIVVAPPARATLPYLVVTVSSS
jgi:hypothetical protein